MTTTNNEQSAGYSNIYDLSEDVMNKIFEYLSLGEIYYSFYHLDSFYRDLINRDFQHLNFLSMSYRYWAFYHHDVIFNNPEHGASIQGLTISNEKPFDQITRFLTLIDSFPNLRKLYLKSPNQEHLEILPTILPNLSHLSIMIPNARFFHLRWLSSLRQLETCSIHAEINGYEIDNSTRSLSPLLTSLSITLSSTYDFHTLLPLLSPKNLNIRLCDSEYEYIKGFCHSIGSAKTITEFTFDMTLRPITSPLSFYGIISLVSSVLRSVQTLTILCRFADGIVIDEEKFRYYLSSVYSVEKFRFVLEMNDLPQSIFNQSAYEHLFWTDKKIHVNIYRSTDEHIKHLRIYTLPLISKEYHLPHQLNRSFQLVRSSRVSNIQEFVYGDPDNVADQLVIGELLRYNPTDYSSNLDLFYLLPYLSSLTVNEAHMNLLILFLSQRDTYPKIRKLHLNSPRTLFLNSIQTIIRELPNLHSISIIDVNEFEIFRRLLHAFLALRSNQPGIIHFCLSGLYFNEIYSSHSDEEEFKNIFRDIFFRPNHGDILFDLSFTPSTRSIDLWF